MPQRAPMAWPNRRRAHCHLPPRALPGAQPRQHDAQCAEQHHKQLGTPPTFLITPGTSRAPRAGAFDAQMPHASRTLPPDCESPRTIPHALPFTPLIAHQLMQLVAQHFASDMHESPRVAQDSAFGSRMERRITLRARCFPIANRLAPSHMLFLLLHSLLTSLCSLLHSILRATCTRALARPSQFRSRMEFAAAALEPPLHVPGGNAAARRAERQCVNTSQHMYVHSRKEDPF